MKRSKSGLTARFKKSASAYLPKPLMGVLMGGTLLTGCGDVENAYMYYTAEDCAADNPSSVGLCQAAYQSALEDAAETAPKYLRLDDCESDFGIANCTDTPALFSSAGAFMPLMAGFMITQAMFDDDDWDIDFKKKKKRRLLPMFSSYSPNSPFAGRMVSANGDFLGRVGSKNVRVKSSAFDSRPVTSRRVNRGGFGRMVRHAASGG